MGRILFGKTFPFCSSGRTTATGLSAVTDGQVSHDPITRLLDGAELNGKTLWTKIKKLVRRYYSVQVMMSGECGSSR